MRLASGRVTEDGGPTPTQSEPPISLTPDHADPATCLVCDEPSADGPLCSAACAAQAALEREKMVVRLRMLDRAGANDLAGELQARAADLTAAVLQWRPTVSR